MSTKSWCTHKFFFPTFKFGGERRKCIKWKRNICELEKSMQWFDVLDVIIFGIFFLYFRLKPKKNWPRKWWMVRFSSLSLSLSLNKFCSKSKSNPSFRWERNRFTLFYATQISKKPMLTNKTKRIVTSIIKLYIIR